MVPTNAERRTPPAAPWVSVHGETLSMSTPGIADNVPVAYDEDLANRIRELIAADEAVSERRMFGGLAFLIGGNMAVSASGRGGLLVRVDPADTEALLSQRFAHPFVMRGRAMDGWLHVEAEGVRSQPELEAWVTRSVTYARSLPAKR
jgi:TfoX/Sxy family transcriptional regulator of competence genes